MTTNPSMRACDVPGASARERAVRLAGALAEMGVRELVLHLPGAAPRTLHARVTDLPGEIAAGPGGVLTTPNGTVRAEISDQGLRVWTSDSDLARALARP